MCPCVAVGLLRSKEIPSQVCISKLSLWFLFRPMEAKGNPEPPGEEPPAKYKEPPSKEKELAANDKEPPARDKEPPARDKELPVRERAVSGPPGTSGIPRPGSR